MKPLAAILLILCLTAQADSSQRAQEAAVADVATTVMGLSLGAAEANPLGLALIPLKLIALDYAAGLPDGEKQTVQSAVGSFWLGAAANNICVIFSLLSGGTFAPLCAAAGVAVALQRWNAGADEREFWALCARERVKNPKMTCEFTA